MDKWSHPQTILLRVHRRTPAYRVLSFGPHVTATREYLEAFARHSSWDVSYVNVVHGAELRFDLKEFDAILHSYCTRMCVEGY
jgi:hypothetical protein